MSAMYDAMRDAACSAPLLLCALVLVAALVSSLAPFSPLEPVLLGLSAILPSSMLLPVAVLATVGHMAAKTLVYLGGRAAAPMIPARQQAALRRVRTLLTRRPAAQRLTVLVSALWGVPPFYLVTVCCGALGLPLRHYLVAGAVGRALRFTALALLPRLLGGG